MNATIKTVGYALATAAAAMFAAGVAMAPVTASAGENVPCFGVNTCQGHAACATANNACAGQNACKGDGFVKVSKEACEQAGGEVKG